MLYLPIGIMILLKNFKGSIVSNALAITDIRVCGKISLKDCSIGRGRTSNSMDNQLRLLLSQRRKLSGGVTNGAFSRGNWAVQPSILCQISNNVTKPYGLSILGVFVCISFSLFISLHLICFLSSLLLFISFVFNCFWCKKNKTYYYHCFSVIVNFFLHYNFEKILSLKTNKTVEYSCKVWILPFHSTMYYQGKTEHCFNTEIKHEHRWIVFI